MQSDASYMVGDIVCVKYIVSSVIGMYSNGRITSFDGEVYEVELIDSAGNPIGRTLKVGSNYKKFNTMITRLISREGSSA